MLLHMSPRRHKRERGCQPPKPFHYIADYVADYFDYIADYFDYIGDYFDYIADYEENADYENAE